MLRNRKTLNVVDADGREYNIISYSPDEAIVYARLVPQKLSNPNYSDPRVGDYMVLSNQQIRLSVYISEFYSSTPGVPLGIKFKFHIKDN